MKKKKNMQTKLRIPKSQNYPCSFRMTNKLRRIKTLDRGYASGIPSFTRYINRIFQNECTLRQMLYIHILGNILRRPVVPNAIPILTSGQRFGRFEAGRPKVFQEDIIHHSVSTDCQSDNRLIAYPKRFAFRYRT